MIDCEATYAALVLLGTHRALGKHLPHAEVIFEYRSSEASTPYQQRREFREGFFLFDEELWNAIDAHNEVYQYEEGLFVGDIPTFDRRVVREALLDAVSRRDYRNGGSTFVRQFPGKLEVVSPGGFTAGVTPENILWKQAPRNRRIADVFAKCGLVERSGQGARLMFERSIRDGKLRPDFSGTDDYEVFLTLHGEVRDPMILGLLREGTRTCPPEHPSRRTCKTPAQASELTRRRGLQETKRLPGTLKFVEEGALEELSGLAVRPTAP